MQNKNSNAQEVINQIIEGIQDKKGKEIVIVDMLKLGNSICDYFVICQGNTPTQVEAIADSVRQYTREHTGVKPIAYEGYRNAQWIIIDYGNIFAELLDRVVTQIFVSPVVSIQFEARINIVERSAA